MILDNITPYNSDQIIHKYNSYFIIFHTFRSFSVKIKDQGSKHFGMKWFLKGSYQRLCFDSPLVSETSIADIFWFGVSDVNKIVIFCKKMPLPPALAAKLAKRGILQQSDTNAGAKNVQKSAEGNDFVWSIKPAKVSYVNLLLTARELEAKLAEETAAQKEKEEQLLELKLKVITIYWVFLNLNLI